MPEIKKVEYLILHHSAGSKKTTVEQIRQMHIAKGWTDIGYHKIVYENGTVKQGRADTVIGAQAFGANAVSLGILAVGNYDIEDPNIKLIDSLVRVFTVLCKRHKLKADRIIGHNEVAKLFNVPEGASACPGKFLRAKINYIRQEVSKRL